MCYNPPEKISNANKLSLFIAAIWSLYIYAHIKTTIMQREDDGRALREGINANYKNIKADILNIIADEGSRMSYLL
jgi:hypothetical protein